MVSAIKNFWSEKETGIAWKVSVFAVILVRIFPLFGGAVSLCIRSECGKMRTRITQNTDIFHEVGNKFPFMSQNFFSQYKFAWLCTLSPLIQKCIDTIITRLIVINIIPFTGLFCKCPLFYNCPLLKHINFNRKCFFGFVWLSRNHKFGSGDFWDKSPSWFLKFWDWKCTRAIYPKSPFQICD